MNLDQIEQQRAEALAFIREETANAVLLVDNDLSPANAARQLGRTFTHEEFDRRLQAMDRRLHTEAHPTNKTKRCLYVLDRRGKTFICAYESGIMPEHSIFSVKTKEVWDGKTHHINKKDLPKCDITPEGIVWHGPTPGMEHVDVPWNEIRRGWRTVLVRLVEERLATPTQVESAFGSDNRPEWRKHLGKGRENTIL